MLGPSLEVENLGRPLDQASERTRRYLGLLSPSGTHSGTQNVFLVQVLGHQAFVSKGPRFIFYGMPPIIEDLNINIEVLLEQPVEILAFQNVKVCFLKEFA